VRATLLNVLKYRSIKELCTLAHACNAVANIVRRDPADIDSIELYASLDGVVVAAQKLDHSRFPGSVCTQDSDGSSEGNV